jgi:hypothetical protein
MKLSHEQRAARRDEIRAAVTSEVAELVRRYGLSPGYIRMITSGLPRPRRGIMRRLRLAAMLRELASLGISRRKSADLLHIQPTTLSAICKEHGVGTFAYDTADAWAPVIAASRERAANMAALYADGRTLEEIGSQYGITRERVRQLIGKHFRMNGSDGGQKVRAERLRAARKAAKDQECMQKHGCTKDQWRELIAIGEQMLAAGRGRYQTPLYAFRNQRNNAGNRGIGWELTAWQWWTIWQQSGKWEQRGRGRGYVMCRKGDTGPYALGNVFIDTGARNSSDGQRDKKKDPSLPIGVSRTKSGKYEALRHVDGKLRYLGRHDTPDLAYAAYLRAGTSEARAA